MLAENIWSYQVVAVCFVHICSITLLAAPSLCFCTSICNCVTSTVWCLTTGTWSTGGLGHMLCKSTEGKTTWALPGLSFHTFLIFESASNTCAFMINMDTVPNTHLFIVDNWLSYLMNTATVMLKKGKRCHVCRHPHSHPCRYPYRQPCSPVCPSLPHSHAQLNRQCALICQGGGKTQTTTKNTASQITLQAVMKWWCSYTA